MRLKKSNSGEVIFRQTTILCALLFLFGAHLRADPANFMVGPITFVRPEEWKWKDPDTATKAAAELIITDAATDLESQVMFSFSNSEAEGVVKRWKGYFAEPPPVNWTVKTNHIHDFTVTYLTVEGTQKSRGKLRPDFALLGAVIKTEKGNVYGRLLGPKKMVQKLTDEFKKMVESALAEN